MAKITINKELCKGCGLCINTCPKNVIAAASESNNAGYFYAEPVNLSDCIGCAMCAQMCPDVCITVER